MAWNLALYLMSAFPLAVAFPVYDGCIVQNGLDLTMKGLAVNLSAKKSSDPSMNVSLFSNQNQPLWTSTSNRLDESKWTPITLNVYPNIELKIGGQTVNGNGTKSITVPPRLVIEGALLMTNCPQGQPIYQLPEVLSEVHVTLDDGDEVMFMSSKTAKRNVNLRLQEEDQELKLIWIDKTVTLETPENKTYSFTDPFPLKFTISPEDYKVTWGNQDKLLVKWKNGFRENLNLYVKMEANGEPVFISVPEQTGLPGISPPTVITNTDSSYAQLDSQAVHVNGLIAALVVTVIIALVCFIVIFLLLYPQFRCVQLCRCLNLAPETGRKQGDGVVRKEADRPANSRPVTPPRPVHQTPATRGQEGADTNILDCPTYTTPYSPVTHAHEAIRDSHNDEEDPMYVKPNEVKPIEVILLEKQLAGKVDFTNSSYKPAKSVTSAPTSMCYTHSSHPAASCNTSAGRDFQGYSQQSDSEPEYANIRPVCISKDDDLYLAVSPY